MLRQSRTGFTLIELLIVVAIIAILAAIAVPNFLEAQTRSKVARIKGDLRALAVAEEAYFVDFNSYTQGQGGTGATAPVQWEGFRMLTTPVPYITSLPSDPFGITWIAGSRRVNAYEFGVGAVGIGPAGRDPLNPGPGWPADTYELESDGPDHDDNTGGNGPAPATGDYPWAANTPVQNLVNAMYDPTNGAVSAGDIFRPGGLVPPGAALQVFYNLGDAK